MRIALGIEYNGTDFCGWQRQNGSLRTVQGAVEEAISRVADHPVDVFCAGRTDTGVHATGQVIHFDTEAVRAERSWILGCNSHLPKDVCVLWAREVDGAFHARFSAERRRYRYVILNRGVRPALSADRVAWTYRPLDEARMAAAAEFLLGEHDFSSYRAVACQAKSPVRTMHHLQIQRQGELIYLDLEANGFLHHMVRNIAGVLMSIGYGDREPEWAREVLEARDRTLGGVTAPPGGLYLVGVTYPAAFGIPRLSPLFPVW